MSRLTHLRWAWAAFWAVLRGGTVIYNAEIVLAKPIHITHHPVVLFDSVFLYAFPNPPVIYIGDPPHHPLRADA